MMKKLLFNKPLLDIVKDADVLAQYFAETDIVLSDEGQKRLKKYLPEKI